MAILNMKGTKSKSNHQNKDRFEFFNPKDPQIHVLNSSVGHAITKARFEAPLDNHFELEALFEGDKR